MDGAPPVLFQAAPRRLWQPEGTLAYYANKRLEELEARLRWQAWREENYRRAEERIRLVAGLCGKQGPGAQQ